MDGLTHEVKCLTNIDDFTVYTKGIINHKQFTRAT